MPESDRRRRRPAVSCVLCRKRKIKCNRQSPCNNCLRSRNGACIYESSPLQIRRIDESSRVLYPSPISKAQSPVLADTASPTSSESKVYSFPDPSSQEVHFLQHRVEPVQGRLSHQAVNDLHNQSVPPTKIDTGIDRSFVVYGDSIGANQTHISRSVSHKTRLFGQSHWINTILLLKDVFIMVDSENTKVSKLVSSIGTAKNLARVIKTARTPPWPSPPTTDLPSKMIADELLDHYLRTIEPIYRILHVPTLRQEYDALWVPDSNPDMAFIVQLKLIFAIGATTYDDTFSLRESAIQWVYQAQTWLAEPVFKPRLQIHYLQTQILFLLARQLADVGAELVWVSTGELIRKAICMGLHRDPTCLPKMTLYAAEMRRRLWNTILEMALQSSLTSGGPPLISVEDFDTQPPSNFDDEQLNADGPVQKPVTEFTQVSVSRALRSTFETRLSVIKFLNDLKSVRGTYAETLQLDAQLRSAYKLVRVSLAQFKGRNEPLTELQMVDFILHRYLSALHVPFFGPALEDSTYAFSRKVVADTSLKLWRAAYPGTSSPIADFSNTSVSPTYNTLQRLSICTTGLYNTVLYQAVIIIAVDLRTTLLEEESINPFPVRPDLLSIFNEAKEWSLQSLKAGETSIKGHLVICVLEADMHALMQGPGTVTTAERLIQAAEASVGTSMPILEEAVAALGHCTDTIEQMTADWDTLISPGTSYTDTGDPMSWILNDTNGFFW